MFLYVQAPWGEEVVQPLMWKPLTDVHITPSNASASVAHTVPQQSTVIHLFPSRRNKYG